MAKAPLAAAAIPFLACLVKAAELKQIKPKQLETATARFENLRDEYIAKGMAPMDAANRAADEATEGFAIDNREAKRRKINQMNANIQVWRDIQLWKERKGKKWPEGDRITAWKALFDGPFDQAPFESYSRIKEGILGNLHASLDGLIEKYRPRLAGAYHPSDGLVDILKEVYGQGTGNAEAKTLADAWKQTTETASRLFRMVGGSMRELPNWFLPQHQDFLKVHGKDGTGMKDWVDNHMKWLDWDKTRRSDASMLKTDAERRAFLEKAWETLSSDGANKIRLDVMAMHSNFADKLDNHRLLFYKDADSWLAMHTTYGSGSIFDVMLQHVNDMAHEIALIKRFGPSPQTTIFNVAQMLRKVNPQRADDEIRSMQAVFSSVMRETGLSRTNNVGQFLAGTRNLLTSALLGSAPLIAIPSDINMALMAKRFNNLEGMRFMSRYLSLMNPLNVEDRQLAVRLGMIAENVQAEVYGARRMLGLDISGPSWTRRLADISTNVSLLSPHTQAARWAFGMEMLGLFADNAGKTFDDLPFKAMFERHGLTAADWDAFRATPAFVHNGATFLRPDDVFKPGDRASLNLMTKLKSMVMDEVKMAVLMPDIISRNALIRDTDPGTFIGELGRSAAMFKNFGVTFTNLVLRRYALTAGISHKNPVAYMGWLIVSMTAIGALRSQLGNISRGEDPQNMADPRFILRSMVTGGGFGIAGDFLFGDYNRPASNPVAGLVGPVGEFFSDTGALTLGNLNDLLDGKDPHAMRELLTYGQKFAPGGHNWWSRLVTDRFLWDTLMKMTDPNAESRIERATKARQKQYGITTWWDRGHTSPERAPDITRAITPMGQ